MWFFDHQPIINAILFGQYQGLLDQTLVCLAKRPAGPLLQLTCVYGKLTPTLLRSLGHENMTLVDVSMGQLELSRRKEDESASRKLLLSRMDAECLGLADNSFSTVLIFFLFHELPHEARQRTFREALRVLNTSGQLVITEYAPLPVHHWLYRFQPSRWPLTHLEPFLNDFWQENLLQALQQHVDRLNKYVELVEDHRFFSNFYRVTVFKILKKEKIRDTRISPQI